MAMDRKFTVIAAVSIVFIIAMYILSGTYAPTTMSYASSRCEKIVYLTFDDGPSDRVTPKILDVLRKEDVKATFFIIGRQAKTRTGIIKRLKKEGHSIGIHSYTHDYKEIYSSPQNLLKDIEKCNTVIEEITGKKSTIYRFPGGSNGLNPHLIQAVKDVGLKYVDWNVTTMDAELWQPTAQDIYLNTIQASKGYDNIVLLAHDSTTKLSTIQALPDIIAYYKNNGYTFGVF